MSLLPLMFASVNDDILRIFALLAVLLGTVVLHLLIRRRFRAALGWGSLFGAAGWLAFGALPRGPIRYEPNVIGDCRAVSSAQAAYASVNNGYYGSFHCLENPTKCGFPAGTPAFLDPRWELASPTKGKYIRSFIPGAPGNGRPDPGFRTFVYLARPVEVGGSTVRTFAIDHTGRLCQTQDGSIPEIVNGALSPECIELR